MTSSAIVDDSIGFSDIDYPFRMLISQFPARDLVHTSVVLASS
jgi:hypothetical protein